MRRSVEKMASDRAGGKMLDFGFYNMDCVEGMKEFPDDYFELAVVDPPYGDAMQNRGVEQVRAKVRKVQESTTNERTSDSRTERGVSRTGGGWATRYDKTKKLLRGTLPPEKSILMNFSASHGTKLSGGGITSNFRRQGAF